MSSDTPLQPGSEDDEDGNTAFDLKLVTERVQNPEYLTGYREGHEEGLATLGRLIRGAEDARRRGSPYPCELDGIIAGIRKSFDEMIASVAPAERMRDNDYKDGYYHGFDDSMTQLLSLAQFLSETRGAPVGFMEVEPLCAIIHAELEETIAEATGVEPPERSLESRVTVFRYYEE